MVTDAGRNRPGTASAVTSNVTTNTSPGRASVSQLATQGCSPVPLAILTTSGAPAAIRQVRTATARPSTNARGQRLTLRPRSTSIEGRIGPFGESDRPAVATRGSATRSSRSSIARSRGKARDGSWIAGRRTGASLIGGADGGGGGGADAVVTGGRGPLTSSTVVNLSSWKKTMFTDTNPCGVRTKSS